MAKKGPAKKPRKKRRRKRHLMPGGGTHAQIRYRVRRIIHRDSGGKF